MKRLALAAACLTACGGDVDLTGTYLVYDHEEGVCGTHLGELMTGYYVVMDPVDVGYKAGAFKDVQLQLIYYGTPGGMVFDHAIDGAGAERLPLPATTAKAARAGSTTARTSCTATATGCCSISTCTSRTPH